MHRISGFAKDAAFEKITKRFKAYHLRVPVGNGVRSRLSPPNGNVLFVPSRNVLLTGVRLGRCKKDNY